MVEPPPEPASRPGLGARAYDGLIRTAALGVRALSRLARVGAGTSAPGVVVERFDPGFVRRRGLRLTDGVVLISGTNGKTTTAAMIAAVLGAQGTPVLTNLSGANLFRGVATAMAIAGGDERAGVFEVDEAALLRMVRALAPRVLVLTNVFRDQLDRFGETETIAAHLSGRPARLPPGSTIVANADDPMLWHAVHGDRPRGFGVESDLRGGGIGGRRRARGLPACGAPLEYTGRTIAHLGRARCPSCSWARSPRRSRPASSTSRRLARLSLEIEGQQITFALGGVHNAYNAAAAVAAADALGIPIASSRSGARRVPAALRPVGGVLVRGHQGCGCC